MVWFFRLVHNCRTIDAVFPQQDTIRRIVHTSIHNYIRRTDGPFSHRDRRRSAGLCALCRLFIARRREKGTGRRGGNRHAGRTADPGPNRRTTGGNHRRGTRTGRRRCRRRHTVAGDGNGRGDPRGLTGHTAAGRNRRPPGGLNVPGWGAARG
ncbi:hypothetical protein MCA0556 [Methylococcus capsulatus str. Bath]|uniref:Uncharacterized protein n=1 Tax=Methylococcus capsulatus (strain ATCC 33009 / NCIMB 11132 / Bath) TaxID=243233 RepID=Q60BC1_METCA|nr:hypothetical protein MCA0556 [Methylococcus capsulatus str. Bath]